ncbi:hypothetical protein AVEN_94881-1, partial [Araneus ventricosus]
MNLLRQEWKVTVETLAKQTNNPMCTPLKPDVNQLEVFHTSDWTAGKNTDLWRETVVQTAPR